MPELLPEQIVLRFGNDYIGSHKSKNGSTEFLYNCIYCEENGKSPDTKGNLYVNSKSLKYFCQRCGASGKVDQSLKGYTFDKIYDDHEFHNILSDILTKTPVDNTHISIEYPIPKIRPSTGTEAWDYLIRRGITPSMMQYYDIRVGSFVSKYKYRIIVPNIVVEDDDENDITDMFVARYFREVPKDFNGKDLFGKYLNPFGENKRKCVFNLNRIPPSVPIIITEGVFSSMSAGSNAVATYGKYVTDTQLTQILNKKPSSIYVSLDPDAYKEAVALCDRIERIVPNLPLYLVDLPEGTDPSDLGHSLYMKFLLASPRYTKSANLIADILK